MKHSVRSLVAALVAIVIGAQGALPTAATEAADGAVLGGSVTGTTGSGVRVTLTANDVSTAGATVAVHETDAAAGDLPELPAGYSAVTAPITVDVKSRVGDPTSSIPHAFAPESTPDNPVIAPGLSVSVPADSAALALADPASVELLWLQPGSHTWAAVPSAFDPQALSVIGYHNMTGTFVGVGLASRTDDRPRVVLDVEDDADAAVWDGVRTLELEQSMALATSVKTMLEGSCDINVTIDRSGDNRFVNADLRALRANDAQPDLLLSLGFYSGDGIPSGTAADGGPKVAALNGSSQGFADELASQLATYTGRPAADDSALPHPAQQPLESVAPIAAHLDVFELDNSFDHAVYSTHPEYVATATARAIAVQLSDVGSAQTAACAGSLTPSDAGDMTGATRLIDLRYAGGGGTFLFDPQQGGTQEGSWPSGNVSQTTFYGYDRHPVAHITGTWGVAEWPAEGEEGLVVVVGCWRYDRPMGYAQWHAPHEESVMVYYWQASGKSAGLNLAPTEHVYVPPPGPSSPASYGRRETGPVCSWLEFWAAPDWTRHLYIQGLGDWDDYVHGTGGWYAPSTGMALRAPLGPPPSEDELNALAQLGYSDYAIFGVDPVDLASGNFVDTEKVETLSGVGEQQIDLSLTYNSADERTSPVGVGWNFAYSSYAQEYDNGSVLITFADGRACSSSPTAMAV